MTYPLLAYCNRRNAAELARVVNLSAAELVRVESLEWAPPTEELDRRDLSLKNGRYVYCGARAWIGRGDKIYCGRVFDASGSSNEYVSRGRRYYNVCRPFDEKWDEPRVPLFDRHPLGEKRTRDDFPYATKFKAENSKPERQTPPNHGHGAACGCGQLVSTPRKSDGLTLFTITRRHKPDCPHCAGTGRLICDDERAGRVSPSHAAGGYAEWRRRNPVQALASVQALDWGAGLAPELMRMWETRRHILSGITQQQRDARTQAIQDLLPSSEEMARVREAMAAASSGPRPTGGGVIQDWMDYQMDSIMPRGDFPGIVEPDDDQTE